MWTNIVVQYKRVTRYILMVCTSIFTEKYTGTLKPRQITGSHNLPALCSQLCLALGTASDPDIAVNLMKKVLKIEERWLSYNPFTRASQKLSAM
jgi:hypothetical protein